MASIEFDLKYDGLINCSRSSSVSKQFSIFKLSLNGGGLGILSGEWNHPLIETLSLFWLRISETWWKEVGVTSKNPKLFHSGVKEDIISLGWLFSSLFNYVGQLFWFFFSLIK